jgi:hypothetical protein
MTVTVRDSIFNLCGGARVGVAGELKEALVQALQSPVPFLLEIEVA